MHTPQPGAQNHKTVGPENSGISDTRSDAGSGDTGTLAVAVSGVEVTVDGDTGSELGDAASELDDVSEPHAARNVTSDTAMTRRRSSTSPN